MQNLAEIITAADIETDNQPVMQKSQENGECSVCGGSGFILRPDGQAEICRCYTERRMQRLFRAARLQPALQKMTFAQFDLANYPANMPAPDGKGRTYYELAREALTKMRSCCDKVIAAGQHRGQAPRGLLLLGQVGSGKTHLAAAAANYLLRNRQRVLFLVPVLILDDLGSHNFSDWTRSVLFSILNYRMNECLTTIATTNLDFVSLQELLGTRSLSRLLSLCEPCLLASDRDIRLRGLEKA